MIRRLAARIRRRAKSLWWMFKIRFIKRPSDKPHDWLLDRPADVLIVGAAKCGTSSLHRYLSKHPDVHATAKKEHHYFCQTVDSILADGLVRKNRKAKAKYQAELDEGKGGQLRVESSPSYLGHPEAAARIFRQNPNTKIIIMTRDYADRVRSNFLMIKRVGQEQRTFEEFQREGIPLWNKRIPYGEPYLRYGHVGRHASSYFKVFPWQNIFIGSMEEMGRNPVGFMRDVALFLGIFPEPFEDMKYKAHNASWRDLPDDWIPGAREALYKYYSTDKSVFDLLPRGDE